MKLMKESISLQNRMILCRAVTRDKDNDGSEHEDKKKELAHEKLTRAYHRAHKLPSERTPNESTKKTLSTDVNNPMSFWSIPSLLTGFCVGTAFSVLIASQLRKK